MNRLCSRFYKAYVLGQNRYKNIYYDFKCSHRPTFWPRFSIWYNLVVFSGKAGLGTISKLGFEVQLPDLKEHLDIETMKIGSGVEARQRSKGRECTLQVSVFLCPLKPEFKNISIGTLFQIISFVSII